MPMLPLFLLAQAAPIPAPPAPPVYVPPSPINMQAAGRPAGPRTRVAVLVRGGGTVLFDGALWVGGRSGASWRQTTQEAPDPACPAARPYDMMTTEYRFS